MASFERKLKRKQMVAARKQFMKDFRSKMANFKKQVKCTDCGRPPAEGENIDDWRINKESENIDLICTSCYVETPPVEAADDV
jgi:Zn finger protein HypA/HybF involved in hydrogenase expression